MGGLDLFAHDMWYPLSFLGFTHQFFGLNSGTIINTWIVLAALTLVSLIARYFLYYPGSIGGYLVKNIIISFQDLITQSLGKFVYKYFAFITSLFVFIISCNWIGVLPLVEEPTKDLNTTLALGIMSFLYIQKEAIFKHGPINYIKDFFEPIFLMLPLNILGELATIVSISFRLFGNIFGGSIIMSIFEQAIGDSWIWNTVTTISGINIIIMVFFVLFEGFLQAFVFSILSLTNLTMAVYEEPGEHLI